MQIIPRIFLNGTCKEAMELYKNTFNAKVDYMMTAGDAKMGTEAQKDYIVNSQLDIEGYKIHMADNINMNVVIGNQLSLTVVLNNADEVKAAFDKLSAEGKVMMAPTPTFFSPCHCVFTDKFGIMWQINCPK